MTTAIPKSSLKLLKKLIAQPSFSGEEEAVADIFESFLFDNGIEARRSRQNVWAKNRHFSGDKPRILLNSHLDTVQPVKGWSQDPFDPLHQDGKLYGLGSNDAGGALVALTAAFQHFFERGDLPFDLILAATAEEERSGRNGVESLLPEIGDLDLAIVGEPTGMQLAVAEKGLMVLDCIAEGVAGHAARDTGKNAIYEALSDIQWFRDFQFPNPSPSLGQVKMSVTLIAAGTQHNVVPDNCRFTVDVRTTDAFNNLEALEIIRRQVTCTVEPRSTRLNPSSLPATHPMMAAAKKLEIGCFGSGTLSDQAVIPYPSVKIGPGESERSHTADEYISIDELNEGISGYCQLLETLAEVYKTTIGEGR